MQFASTNLSSIIYGLSVSLAVQLQKTGPTEQDVQNFAAKWLPLTIIIGLVIICLTLACIAIFLFIISTNIVQFMKFRDERSKDASDLRSILSEIKKVLEEKRS